MYRASYLVLHPAGYIPYLRGLTGGGLALDLGLRWLYIVMNLQLREIGMLQFLYRLLISSPQLDTALLHLPIKDADARVTANGEHVAFFQDAINNLNGDEPFWDDKDILCDRGSGKVPATIIGGWYDFFVEEQQDFAAAAKSSRHSRLIVGDFAHWDMHKYTSVLHSSALELFDRHLKNKAPVNSDDDDLPVR